MHPGKNDGLFTEDGSDTTFVNASVSLPLVNNSGFACSSKSHIDGESNTCNYVQTL